ncbi:MlaD family protein [Microbulbifer sp. CAU 1566]|uniref:MlaD family protein n=1 Tax=Microbulbifer sp. CAU 1566 TaxID=2933269 RepID=UPI002003A077|nr:MlaD family protein [Microbulbifer sp. CAU 1566]MCK7596684.1 MlaD family protein [Microbulbifer sp. CAU 1566]
MTISIANRARLVFAVVVLLSVVAAAIWYYQSAGRHATFQILTEDSVSGLIAGAPVEFHGVDVGRVTEVELTGPSSVRILLEVEKDAPVTRATVATITARGLATRGFTGYVYILLENVGNEQGPLTAAPGARYPRIPNTPSRSVNLDTAISQVNQNVQSLTDLLRTVLDTDTIASIQQAVGNLQQVTQMLAQNQQKLSAIIANTEHASGRLGPLLDSSSDTVNALRQVSRMLAGNQQRLDSIIANTEQASGRLGPLLESSTNSANALQLQVLPEAYRTMATLNQLSHSMTRLTDKINRDPSILVRGSAAPPLGPGEAE